MKKYVIILSKIYPQGHSKAGQRTLFREKMQVALGCPQCGEEQELSGENITHCNSCMYATMQPKLHTIRGNYELWEKRFKEIEAGKACISVRYWVGKPYRSAQQEIACLTKDDGIGLQKLEFFLFDISFPKVDGGPANEPDLSEIAENDGFQDSRYWADWFRKADLSESFAIIHFTKFRY